MENNGYKDEIFTKRVRAGKRTYFFDVKSTKSEKDFYITVTESKRVGEDEYEKHKIFLYKEDFEKFLRMKPDIPIKLTKLIGLRLKKIENRIENLLYKDVPSRLARILLDLGDESGYIDNMGVRLKSRLTHQELASLITSTRETVSLILGEFRDKGLIEFNRKEIIIRNKNGLIKYL